MTKLQLIQPGDLILFQGDSITNAFRKPEEICNAYQLGSGYALMVAAQLLASRPKDELRFANRGISGEGIEGLLVRWHSDCLDLKPDVLSILIGVNDVQPTLSKTKFTAKNFERDYRELLTFTRTALPKVRLVLCEPFVLHVGNVRKERLADVTLRGTIVRRLATEFNALHVPLQQAFNDALKEASPEYWSYDGIHPNAQGHWLIAQAWIKATKTMNSIRLPKRRAIRR